MLLGKKIAAPLLLGVLLLAIFLAGCRSSEGPVPGNAAPDFTLSTPDGQTVTLSDLRGRPVLISFWASWCPTCREQMPLLQDLHQKAGEQGVLVLSVNYGETSSVAQDYMQKGGFTFPVVLDTDMEVAAQYAVHAVPENFLIDKDGVIRFVKRGPFVDQEEIDWALGLVHSAS